MDKKHLMPQAAQPVNRITTGQLPAELAELSEEALSQCRVVGADADEGVILPSYGGEQYNCRATGCSYDGDDAE